MTRFDITYAVAKLSHKLAAPTKADARAAKRIFYYLAGTSHYALVFKTPKRLTGIVTYTDASYGNDMDTRRGFTGVLTSVDENVICVISRRQRCVAISSTESEYYAMGTGTCDALWIKLWRYEVYRIKDMITLLVDNQSAMQLAEHDGIHQRSKHIDKTSTSFFFSVQLRASL